MNLYQIRMWFDDAPDAEIAFAWFAARTEWGAELQAMIAYPEYENYEVV